MTLSPSLLVRETGTAVAPGDVLYEAPATELDSESGGTVQAGEGSYLRMVATATGAQHVVVLASRLGVAQWEGASVSVFRPSAGLLEGGRGALAAVLGPRPGDMVHLRVLRVSRLFAFGEITAINGTWASHKGVSGSFRGVLRVEDIRPFRPTKDELKPPPPSHSFQCGDVVVAEVISQSDVRQYQLSTLDPRCGVVESHVLAADGETVRLEHLPYRRDAMLNSRSGAVLARWCPLLTGGQ